MDILRFLTRHSPRLAKKRTGRLFGDEQWFLAVNAGRPVTDSAMTGRTPYGATESASRSTRSFLGRSLSHCC